MKSIAITTLLLCFPAFLHALPPVPPDRAELIRHSDVVAIVTVTNVTERVVGKRKSRTQQQRADAKLERLVKGTAPQTLRITYDSPVSDVICRPDSLRSGRFLLFLRRDGETYVRTDAW